MWYLNLNLKYLIIMIKNYNFDFEKLIFFYKACGSLAIFFPDQLHSSY